MIFDNLSKEDYSAFRTHTRNVSIESIFNVASLIDPVPDAKHDLVHRKSHALPDLSAPVTRHVASASYRQFVKGHNGNLVAFANTAFSAEFMLIREECCAPIIMT